MRVDIVGVEKELNFLNLYQEVAFLIAGQHNDVMTDSCSSITANEPLLELVFVIREDMLPATLRSSSRGGTHYGLDFKTKNLLRIRVVEGTYGGDSLNPDLDCGSQIGQPDMIIAFNAGLFAYDS